MPHRYEDPMVQRFRIAGALVFIVMGAGYLLGPDVWRSSPSFVIIRRYCPAGLRGWGAVFLVIGIAELVVLLRHRYNVQRIFAIVGAGITMAWAASFIAAALIGKLTGISGPALWAFFSFAQATQARRLDHRNQ